MASEARKPYGKSVPGFTVYLMAGEDRTKYKFDGPWTLGNIECLIGQLRRMSAPLTPEVK